MRGDYELEAVTIECNILIFNARLCSINKDVPRYFRFNLEEQNYLPSLVTRSTPVAVLRSPYDYR